MRPIQLLLPTLALGIGSLLVLPAMEPANAYVLLGGDLSLNQRQYSIVNNFTGARANNNQREQANFPGHFGAVVAIWKGVAEWGSLSHGDGQGDPTQARIGSGGANFDSSFQSEVTVIGDTNSNTMSTIAGSQMGVFGFCETPISDGWRIRFYSAYTWSDGPGPPAANQTDIQAVACHEYGHALGLDHTAAIGAATMKATYGGGVSARSIELDDKLGLEAIYGTISATKPRITKLSLLGTQLTITGTNFSSTGNEVWFTGKPLTGSGIPVKVTNVISNGTKIVVTVPTLAGPGDVLVRKNGTSHGDLSNAWPTALTDDPSICLTPVNYCQSLPNSGSGGAIMGWNNEASLSTNNFELKATRLPTGKWGIFFYGSGQRDVAFGDGRLCIAGAITRLKPQLTDSAGEISRILDFTLPPLNNGAGQVIPGQTTNFQFWFRDPGFGISGFNTTDGLAVRICE